MSSQQISPAFFPIPLNSKQKGNLTELLCMAAFYSRGYNVCQPFGENSRYDFIADVDGILIRVQVKTSRQIGDGVYEFSCRSMHANNRNKVISKKYTKNEIDFFCSVIENKFILVPVEECSTAKAIRTKSCSNNRQKHANMLEDYELDKIIEKIKSKKNVVVVQA